MGVEYNNDCIDPRMAILDRLGQRYGRGRTVVSYELTNYYYPIAYDLTYVLANQPRRICQAEAMPGVNRRHRRHSPPSSREGRTESNRTIASATVYHEYRSSNARDRSWPSSFDVFDDFDGFDDCGRPAHDRVPIRVTD